MREIRVFQPSSGFSVMVNEDATSTAPSVVSSLASASHKDIKPKRSRRLMQSFRLLKCAVPSLGGDHHRLEAEEEEAEMYRLQRKLRHHRQMHAHGQQQESATAHQLRKLKCVVPSCQKSARDEVDHSLFWPMNDEYVPAPNNQYLLPTDNSITASDDDENDKSQSDASSAQFDTANSDEGGSRKLGQSHSTSSMMGYSQEEEGEEIEYEPLKTTSSSKSSAASKLVPSSTVPTRTRSTISDQDSDCNIATKEGIDGPTKAIHSPYMQDTLVSHTSGNATTTTYSSSGSVSGYSLSDSFLQDQETTSSHPRSISQLNALEDAEEEEEEGFHAEITRFESSKTFLQNQEEPKMVEDEFVTPFYRGKQRRLLLEEDRENVHSPFDSEVYLDEDEPLKGEHLSWDEHDEPLIHPCHLEERTSLASLEDILEEDEEEGDDDDVNNDQTNIMDENELAINSYHKTLPPIHHHYLQEENPIQPKPDRIESGNTAAREPVSDETFMNLIPMEDRETLRRAHQRARGAVIQFQTSQGRPVQETHVSTPEIPTLSSTENDSDDPFQLQRKGRTTSSKKAKVVITGVESVSSDVASHSQISLRSQGSLMDGIGDGSDDDEDQANGKRESPPPSQELSTVAQPRNQQVIGFNPCGTLFCEEQVNDGSKLQSMDVTQMKRLQSGLRNLPANQASQAAHSRDLPPKHTGSSHDRDYSHFARRESPPSPSGASSYTPTTASAQLLLLQSVDQSQLNHDQLLVLYHLIQDARHREEGESQYGDTFVHHQNHASSQLDEQDRGLPPIDSDGYKGDDDDSAGEETSQTHRSARSRSSSGKNRHDAIIPNDGVLTSPRFSEQSSAEHSIFSNPVSPRTGKIGSNDADANDEMIAREPALRGAMQTVLTKQRESARENSVKTKRNLLPKRQNSPTSVDAPEVMSVQSVHSTDSCYEDQEVLQQAHSEIANIRSFLTKTKTSVVPLKGPAEDDVENLLISPPGRLSQRRNPSTMQNADSGEDSERRLVPPPTLRTTQRVAFNKGIAADGPMLQKSLNEFASKRASSPHRGRSSPRPSASPIMEAEERTIPWSSPVLKMRLPGGGGI